ncbi:MAG: IS4 family transposase [Anaerolineales bacterium]
MSKLKNEYRELANPKRMKEFLNGKGILAKRQEVAEEFNYDWHARKLNFEQHLRGLVLMQVTAYRSTRDYQHAAENDLLFHANGAGVEISVSGLAQANRNRPLEPFLAMMQAVMTAVENLPARKLRVLDKRTWQGIVGLLHRTELFDATTLKLPPKLSKWVPGKHESTAGMKMQLCIDGERGDFKRILFTPEPGNDSPYFEAMLGNLAEQEGRIYIFDAGYWKIQTYHDIVESGNDFVTKRAGKIKPHLVKELPLPNEGPLSSGYEVLQDAQVRLGDYQDRLFRMLRVRQTNGQEITLISSLLDLSADQICLLYRYRWTIEIVFRWLRQTLELEHLTSHDPIGILRQILTALIVWGLLVIANQDSGKLSPKQLWRQLQADIHQAVFEYGFCLGFQGAMSLLSK